MTEDEAKAIVETRLAATPEDDLVLVITSMERLKAGWVFFYNNKRFLETGNFVEMLAGNCPIFISRDGDMLDLPTWTTWQNGLKLAGYSDEPEA